MSEIKTTIPEARQIMADLHSWLDDIGAFVNTRIRQRHSLGQYETISTYSILFCRDSGVASSTLSFSYTIRGLTSRKAFAVAHRKAFHEEYLVTDLISSVKTPLDVYEPFVKILPISAIIDRFTMAMKLDRRHFPILDNYDPDS